MAENGEKSFASSGVEALIERLRNQGVAEGRAQAERLVLDAERRADWMLEQARREAESILENARREAERLRFAGEEALRVAARDTVLDMKDTLTRRFRAEIQRLVARELKDESFVQRLILEVVERARQEGEIDRANQVEILLPRELIGLDDLRRKPEELREGSLSHFVLVIAKDLLREGVRFGVSKDGAGIRVRLVEQNVEIDVSERAVADLLLQHLQPRFRALLEGIVK